VLGTFIVGIAVVVPTAEVPAEPVTATLILVDASGSAKVAAAIGAKPSI
jgi:hypothetical protein